MPRYIPWPCLEVLASCPLSFLRCTLLPEWKWVRSAEGGAISLEQRAQIPTLCFQNSVAPRSRGSVWSPLYQAGWSRQPQGFTNLLPPAEQGGGLHWTVDRNQTAEPEQVT